MTRSKECGRLSAEKQNGKVQWKLNRQKDGRCEEKLQSRQYHQPNLTLIKSFFEVLEVENVHRFSPKKEVLI